jgi:hypothetical protein
MQQAGFINLKDELPKFTNFSAINNLPKRHFIEKIFDFLRIILVFVQII